MASTLHRLARIDNLKAVWDASGDARGRRRAAGLDNVHAEDFARNLHDRFVEIRRELIDGQYKFSDLRAIAFRKPNSEKYRIICVPTVRDRLVQRVLVKHFLSKDVDRLGIKNSVSYGFIPGADRGVAGAVKDACKLRSRMPWAFKTDILSFFDVIDRNVLIDRLRTRVRSKGVQDLLRMAISCEIGKVDPDTQKKIQTTSIKAGAGLRQGMPLSPILSNFFLKDFDAYFEQRRQNLVRYADDLVIFADTREECEAYEDVCRNLLGRVDLQIPDLAYGGKTKIFAPDEPAEFLGFEITRDGRSKYAPMVPKVAFDELKEKICAFQSYATIGNKYKRIEDALAYLNRVVDGYVNAYHVAENKSDLDSHLKNLRDNSRRKLFESIFGAGVINGLSTEQKEFLSLV